MNEGYGLEWRGRLAARWGHWAPQMLMFAIAVVILMGLRPLPSTSLLALFGPLLLLVFVVVTWLLMRQHDRRLCESCAAAMPLNPAQLAARYGKRFWLAHAGGDMRFVIPYLIALIGSNFITFPGAKIIWAAMQASMMYLIASYATHRRLQPWCPWCQGGGGGDPELDDPVTPDPVPGNRRQFV